MIDIHSHIIPYIDDGARNDEEAVEMALIAVQEGISGMIAAPHYIAGTAESACKNRVEEETARLNALFEKEGINLKIYPGCEAFILPEVPRLLKQGVICTLNNSSYAMLEFPMNLIPLYADKVFFEIQLMGMVPVVAHPERNNEVARNPEILKEYVEKGILFQVNAGSITGSSSEKISRLAWKLMEDGLVHMVSTDAHNQRSRAPKMSDAFAKVSQRLGNVNAELLFKENPRRVLANEEVQGMEPSSGRKFPGAAGILRLIQGMRGKS